MSISKSVCINSPELFSEELWAGWEGGVGLGAGLPLAAAMGSLLLGIPILLGVVGLTHVGT